MNFILLIAMLWRLPAPEPMRAQRECQCIGMQRERVQPAPRIDSARERIGRK
jgi:hypothetical protein